MDADPRLDRRAFLRLGPVALLAGVAAGACRRERAAAGTLAMSRQLGSLGSATAWINSPPLTAEQLAGRVTLVQFCTFTCINWLRTLPNVRAWADQYGKAGLVVIGAHTPEFSFEHDPANVRQAIAALGVRHPIAVDSGYTIWDAFDNSAWPALYLFDTKGQLRYRHFGEDEPEVGEGMIRTLLEEAGTRLPDRPVSPVAGKGIEAAADWPDWKSPENYLGYEKTVNFRSPGGLARRARHAYTIPSDLELNEWALGGAWTAGPEAIALDAPHGKIAYRFHSRDAHLVMGPATKSPVRFRVRLDGAPPGDAHGLDVDAQGMGTADARRLHQLIRQPGTIADRTLEIEFLDPGVDAYSFTFG